jgi:hypothetical protein
MKFLLPTVVLLSLVQSGCDTINGVRRSAYLHTLPDLEKVKSRIEAYPEITEVTFKESEGSRPLTFAGIQQPDRVFHLFYTDSKDVSGSLMFISNFKNEVYYSQSLFYRNSRPSQKRIDATWPVMKKIENDLITEFGFTEIKNTVKSHIRGVENPERKTPNQSLEPTTMAVTPAASHPSRQL